MSYKSNLAAACIVALAACTAGPTADETATVALLTVGRSNVELEEQYAATIEGRQDVAILPQIEGKLSGVAVSEGQRVKRGQVMFVIDPVPYQAALRTAVANVQAAEAAVRTAELEVKRKKILLDEQVISDYEYAVAENTLASAQAALEQSRAGEVNARNDLSYTEVRSPANGVMGTLPYREGALVGPAMERPLTTVSDNEQMYVYFSMSESQLRSLFRQYGSPDSVISRMPPVSLRLSDGTLYDRPGRVESISGIVNPLTGTASVRSTFPNPDRLLLSGGVGNVVISRTESGVLTVPQSATYEVQDKVYVYLVADGTALSTEIKVEPLNDGRHYVVRSGLEEGDVIAAEGVGNLKDGQPVRPRVKDNKVKES